MGKSYEQKAAEALVNAASRVDTIPMLFVQYLRGHPARVERKIVEMMVLFLREYLRDADNPHLRFRTDSLAADIARSIDLTEFDQ